MNREPHSQLKTIVVNEIENTRVPFLRGILTRSLLDAGLQFEDAFDLATRVRDALTETAEVKTDTIRENVFSCWKNMATSRLWNSIACRWLRLPKSRSTAWVAPTSAFSRGRHERYLQASGMKPRRPSRRQP